MPRVRGRLDPTGRSPTFDLLIGPTDAPGEYTIEELELLWERHGPEIMAGPHGRHGGTRPWAWWVFEAGEEQPSPVWDSETRQWEGEGDETVRLVELGELTDAELAALREQANEARLRMGTRAERISGGWRDMAGAVLVDAEAVDLWERVEAALER
jgi:hypothetical protein